MNLLSDLPAPRLLTLFATLGAITAIPLTYRLLQTLYIYNRPSSLPRYARPNAYALITGASDGIGRGLARALASEGFNLILHGRNSSKLEAVKSELLAAHPILDIRLLIIDASQSHGMKQSIEAAVTTLSALPGPLTILINNAGGAGAQRSTYLPLEDLSHGEVDGMLNLNLRFPMQLTRALMPQLLASQPALLLNISSGAGRLPTTYLPVYSATKAAGEAWSVSMARTLQNQGHDVLAQVYITGKVCGTTHNKDQEGFFMPNSDDYARACLRRVGCGKLTMAPWWPAALQMWMLTFFTESRVTGMVERAIEKEMRVGREAREAERKTS